ncbi:MAG: Gfo/Idh/MocA family oxidoreductase [Kiritimatiellae bacterium]|nr:Gfo/Idh/MocA family oxidoreductase [Kiritimatiellia bacterium]
MKMVRVGIIGQGRSGRDIHGNQISRMPDRFKIVAVSDPLAERRARAEQEYGCASYSTPRGLFGRTDIDLIVNASPSHLHVPLSIQALEAGFNVLCEKPLARKVAEVDKVVRAAKKAGKLMAVFQNNRYADGFQQVRKVIESGVLGRIVLIKAGANGFSRRWDWQTLRKNYGGNLLNTGPHSMDQILQLFGTDVMPKVTCIMDRANTFGDAEDHVKVILQAKGHPTVDLEISSCCAYPQYSFNVYGTRGGLLADREGIRWRYFKPGEQPKQSLVQEPLVSDVGTPVYCKENMKWHEAVWEKPKDGKSGTAQYYEMLYRTLSKGAPLEVTLAHIRQQIAVMEECHRQNPPSKMPKADV